MALTQISTAGVKDDAVTSGKIPANAVGSSELADNAVDTAAIADDAITNAKIGASAAIARTKLANVDLVDDSSPQLGAQLDTNGNDISHGDGSKAKYGASNDLQIHHTSNHSTIENATGELRIRQNNGSNMVLNSNGRVIIQVSDGENAVYCDNDGAVKLHYNGAETFKTTNEGVTFDTNSSSCVVRLTSNSNAETVLQGFNSDFNIKAPSGGDLYLMANGNESAIDCLADGAVKLYHDNSKRLETFDLGIDIGINATGNYGIRWGGDNFNYCNIWAEYGSGDIFIAGGLKQKGTSGGFFSSYGASLSRNAIQVNAFGNSGIQFYTSDAQNVAKDASISVPERLRIEGDGDLRISSDDVSSNFGFIDGWVNNSGNMIIGADQSTTGSNGSNLIFRTRGGERARIQHGGGISFNGDTAAANALDDYEEGTFSATATAAGYSGGSAIAMADEKYTKIGRIVHFNMRLQVASSLSDGDLTISGLPFSASQDSVVDFSWQDAAGFNGGQGKINGTSCVRFNGNFPTHHTGNANIIFSGTYTT